ncbi:hypothetical protein BPNPMPFG_005049 [Mesorhizobium sp. AR07]|uniref:SGNH/GDSL hydrolase family protein n=1 Tax=Mesorhizobium sp. AR07 TaxID=2865838 RepID=UPI00215E95E1|nr:SGNH/GDSL hydrolase family protein [Mesorhizobium sp. AR07]UVK43271.1 hypothetical protein BPNPMPFG_005049 [Mesorhizobium sp. AR07]
MPRNGSGTFVQPAGTAAVPNTTIQSTPYNNLIADIGNEITGSLPINGVKAMTANLPMGNNRVTGVANPISGTDAATKSYVDLTAATTPEQSGSGAVGFTSDASPGDDTAAILAMLHAVPIGGEVYLSKSYNVTGYQNFNAAQYTGPGEIVTTVAANSPALLGGLARLNWGNDANMDVFGEEYLYAVRKEILAGNNITGTIYGDSTFANPSAVISNTNNYPENALNAIAAQIGLPTAFSMNNIAKAGTTFNDAISGNTKDSTSIVSNLGPTKKLIMMKFGLNEANKGSPGYPTGGAPRTAGLVAAWTQLAADLRAGLASIRSQTYGTLDATSIIYFGPNAAQNTGYQDFRYLETAIKLIKQICREFNVMYIDTYHRWNDAYTSNYRWTDGAWSDYPTNTIPGYGPLHPNDIGWSTIWGAVKYYLDQALVTPDNKTNKFLNPPVAAVAALAFSALPNAFQKGISQYRVTTANGWPANGMVTAFQSGDLDLTTQILHVDGSGTTFIRRKNTGANTWTAFTGSLATITLANTWVQDATGTLIGCRIGIDGKVHLQGAIKNGTITSGTDFGTLPVGFRASIEARLGGAMTSGGTPIGIGVRTNGTMYWVGTASATWTSLDGLSFYP